MRRDWAFYVQLCGLALFWCFALSVGSWFAWRAYELARYGDVWKPAVILGSAIGPIFITFATILTYVFVKLAVTHRPRSTWHAPPPEIPVDPTEEILMASIIKPSGPWFKAVTSLLALIFLSSLGAWYWQVKTGLQVTGMNRPVFWGLYITDFVFFIGISHAGTLVSAILRISQAEWRRSITRAAEAITVLVLFFGAWSILLDMGRVDRMLKVFQRGRLESPLLWDVCSITTYLTASVLYLYLPLIPDVAILKTRVKGWRRHFYHLLSFGWTGAPEQVHAIERAIGIMAVVVVPIAVSVHTVVSWVFALTVQPMWHSAIFGPYFVVGAIFSGIAALLIAMAIIRKGLHLEKFLRDVHFNYLGLLLLIMAFLWFYFTLSEYVTVLYGNEPVEMTVWRSKVTGPYAPLFWGMVIVCFVIPVPILCRAKTRTVTGTVVASIGIVIGMWLERYTIVVPTLERSRLGTMTGYYVPTAFEWWLLCGAFAGFALLYLMFPRLFPIVSLWEVREGRLDSAADVGKRVRAYFPETEKPKAGRHVVDYDWEAEKARWKSGPRRDRRPR
jgi:molybdopterin-containing oxidoreductase family membrane subunit